MAHPVELPLKVSPQMPKQTDLDRSYTTCSPSKAKSNFFILYRYTGPLTVLLGLFSSSSSPLSSSSLTIHLVGARAAEVADLDSWEIILAHLPKLKRLTVVMVGPELT